MVGVVSLAGPSARNVNALFIYKSTSLASSNSRCTGNVLPISLTYFITLDMVANSNAYDVGSRTKALRSGAPLAHSVHRIVTDKENVLCVAVYLTTCELMRFFV